MRRGLTLLLVLAGCGAKARPAGPAAGPGAKPGPELGEIRGHVRFAAMPPTPSAPEAVDRGIPACKDAPADEGLVTLDHGVGNAVVTLVGVGRLQPAAGPDPAVTIDQKGCRFVPHVSLAWPGQPVEVTNSDPFMHNVHTYQVQGDDETGLNNISQPEGAEPTPLEPPEGGKGLVRVHCDVHPWMTGYVKFIDGPSLITPADGAFRLAGLAPGHYTVETWHERLGVKRAQVEVRAGQATELAVDY